MSYTVECLCLYKNTTVYYYTKMCGIFFVHGSPDVPACIEGCMTLQPRGPDQTTIMFDNNTFMGFQRLKINGLTDAGNQPMYRGVDETYMICNGEIFDWKEFNDKYDLGCQSGSDCEVILNLYCLIKFDPSIVDAFPDRLDGEFAFVIHDKAENSIIACRDPYGVRPLFYYHTNEGKSDFEVGFASELKALHKIVPEPTLLKQFPPGTIMVIDLNDKSVKTHKYVDFPITYDVGIIEDDALRLIRDSLTQAVRKRLMSDRPIGALLSGGLDSSLVASIASRHIAPGKLETFCIGFKGSTDLHYANLVAEHIGSKHHVIEVQEEEFLNAIEETIQIIESYDITSVRASVGNLLVSKYVATHTDCKVLYNGDYSDEVSGSYLYFKNAPTENDFHNECIRLVQDICYFDSLRSDRTISSQGLEARAPFSDKKYVQAYMSLDPKLRMCNDRIEKYMLRKAFENEDLLPNEVLWRSKTAFSDGVSCPDHSWHKIVQEFISTKVSDEEFQTHKGAFLHNPPQTKEAYYYRMIFEKHYPGFAHVIPYYWLPRWSGDIQDPSARELDICQESAIKDKKDLDLL